MGSITDLIYFVGRVGRFYQLISLFSKYKS
jgi:hypothetical protein